MKTKEKNKAQKIGFALLCGLFSFLIDFWLIPTFLMQGIPDAIWMVLMIVLPAVAAVVFLRLLCHAEPKYVFWGLLVPCVLTLIFYRPISEMIGYRLGGFAEDLFDWIAYLIFAFGFSFGASAAQFFVLWAIKKFEKKK